ncbi:MAG: hypothetical protein RIT81_24240 [Deltaproteobacteria bacterium]
MSCTIHGDSAVHTPDFVEETITSVDEAGEASTTIEIVSCPDVLEPTATCLEPNGICDDADVEALLVSAVADQTALLEDFGIEVRIPTETYNYRSPQFGEVTAADAVPMAEALAMVEALEGEYGIDLQGPGTWTPEEIEAVYAAVTSSAAAAYDRAVAEGYDVESPQQVFRDVYVGEGDTLEIQRFNRGTLGENQVYAINNDDQILLAHATFYHPDDFTPTQLIAHELGHQLTHQFEVDYSRSSFTTTQDHTIVYRDADGEAAEAFVEAGTSISMDYRQGFTWRASSLKPGDYGFDWELEADAIAAYALGESSYTLGPEYSHDRNLWAIARMDQGEALMNTYLALVYGED